MGAVPIVARPKRLDRRGRRKALRRASAWRRLNGYGAMALRDRAAGFMGWRFEARGGWQGRPRSCRRAGMGVDWRRRRAELSRRGGASRGGAAARGSRK